jgi:hypothetical protein
MRRLRLALTLSFALAMPAADAQVVIYRCTDAAGAVTLQNGTPCPKGSKQQKKVMETPAPAPMTVAPVSPPAPVEPEPARTPVVAPAPPPAPTAPTAPTAPQLVIAPRQPPPALFECETWNGDRYFGETAQPPPRCAPLQVTGLDGTGAMAGGAACQMMEDRCQPVADAALCDAWRQRVRVLDARTTFGSGETVTPAEAERIRSVLAESNCAP